MKKLLHLIFILCLIISSGNTSTLIPAGTAVGDTGAVTWTIAGQPYLIDGDITIENLTIKPGVEVLFTGSYKMQVTGFFNAHGSYSDSIKFSAFTIWKGIEFLAGSSRESKLSFCSITKTDKQAIKMQEDILLITNCLIMDNSGNGIEIDNSRVTIENSVIKQNAKSGINVKKGSWATLIINNSLIVNNDDYGIYTEGITDQVHITNSTVANNINVGIFCDAGFLNIINSIVYFNSNAITSEEIRTTVTFSNINSAAIYPGEGNIKQDPDFIDNITYHLNAGSPCIDKGDSSLTYSDIYFPPSQVERRNDMGAYGGPGAGKWIGQLSVDSSYIDFGKVSISNPLILPFTLKNLSDSTINVTDVSFSKDDSSYFSTSNNIFSVVSQDSYNVDITFAPDFGRNYSTETMLINNKGSMRILLLGEGLVPVITLSDSLLAFDSVAVWEDSLQEITIYNVGQSDLIIYKDSLSFSGIDSTQFSLTKLDKDLTIPVNDSAKIEIKFSPTDSDSSSATLNIVSNDPLNSLKQVSLIGQSYFKPKPVIHFSNSYFDFGRIKLDQDSLRQLKIYNIGEDSLIIYKDSLEILGLDKEDFSFAELIDNLVIHVGDSASIAISFSPTTSGEKKATLSIASNDRDSSKAFVNLTGAGIKPEITLSTYQLQFGEVFVGKDSIAHIKIYNTGEEELIIYKDSLSIEAPGTDIFNVVNLSEDFYIAVDDSSTINVHFAPSDSGLVEATLKIISNDPDNTTEEVMLSGYGIKPVLQISHTQLTFGQIPLRENSLRQLTISNDGNTDLIIYKDSLNISGAGSKNFYTDSWSSDLIIAQGSSEQVNVYFSPIDSGFTEANLNFISNDPDNSHKQVTLLGRGIAKPTPVIYQEKDYINFGNVNVSKDSTQQITIYNIGQAELNIFTSSLNITGNDSLIFFIEPISGTQTISFGDSLNLEIGFAPKSDGYKSAILNINSNDPVNATLQIPLSGTGIINPDSLPKISVSQSKLDFNSVIINKDSTQQLTIFNSGSSDLIIHKDGLNINGSGASVFSLEEIDSVLRIPKDDSAKVEVCFTPTDTTNKTAKLVIQSNDVNNTPKNITLNGSGILDPIASFEFNGDVTSKQFIKGQNIVIGYNISASAAIDSAFIYYKMGGASEYTQVSLTNSAGNTWQTTIEGSDVTERGLEYYVESHHRRNVTKNVTKVISVEVPLINFPDETLQNKYQLISIPIDIDQQKITDLLVDDLGTYNDTKYRVFDYIQDSGYVELSNLDQPLNNGKSVWLITKSKQTLDIENGTSITTASDFEINLTAGWNMIGNPFAFPVSWSLVDTNHVLRFYDGSDWPFKDVLEPYKGYAVKVESDTTIFVPPNEYISLPKKTDGILAGSEWYFQISGTGQNVFDRYNYAGVKQNATNGIDKNDHAEPPPIGEFLSVAFVNDKFADKKYSTDFREEGLDGYTFNLNVESNVTAQKALQFIPENLPENFDWQVISPQLKIIYNKSNITISNNQKLQLIVGTEQYINNVTDDYKHIPTKISLKQNYPNPFNPETTIAFELTDALNVKIDIYNILGKHIKTLVNNRVMDAGYHKIKWSGFNQSDYKVSSSIYFLHFKAGRYTKTIKMIMSK